MLEKALKFIFAKAEEKKDNVEFVEDFGCKYVLDKNVGRLSLHCPPGMDTIEIFTLSGIVDFLSINIDKFNIPVIVMLQENKESIKEHYIKDGFEDYLLIRDLKNELERIINNY